MNFFSDQDIVVRVEERRSIKFLPVKTEDDDFSVSGATVMHDITTILFIH